MAATLSELVQFFTSPEQKALLEQWAAEDDRSVAYIIRNLIEAEIARRAQSTQKTKSSQLPEAA